MEKIEFDTIDQKNIVIHEQEILEKIQNLGISDDEQQLHALREARMIYENAIDNNMTLKQATMEIDFALVDF